MISGVFWSYFFLGKEKKKNILKAIANTYRGNPDTHKSLRMTALI